MNRSDPRIRLILAAVLSIFLAIAQRPEVLAATLSILFVAAVVAGLAWRELARRLAAGNLLLLPAAGLLPLAGTGVPQVSWGPLTLSEPGLHLAGLLLLKGNALVLTLVLLLGSLDLVTLGHALAHLRIPGKLAHLFLFTVRYLEVLEQEQRRLATAMRVRGFRPRLDRHTFRALGYLVGMLLVRSVERSRRITAAMKCRGFAGQFYLLDHFHLSRGDLPAGVVALMTLFALMIWEWWPR